MSSNLPSLLYDFQYPCHLTLSLAVFVAPLRIADNCHGAIGKHALTNALESNKKVGIARGAVHAERSLSNPMNLIRVMPAKGSGLLGTEVSEHEEWPDAAFPLYGEAAFFLLFANRKSYGNCATYQRPGGAAGKVHN